MSRSSILFHFLVVAGLAISSAGFVQAQENDKSLPNIIHIFTDDLGYGDLACFGAEDIETPNIDRMAQDGIRFTEFYSASPVCSPSRAALLTGRLPQRFGVHDVFWPSSFTGMPTDEITIAQLLKQKGYATGIVGKWHLGHMPQYLPLQRGFDSYFGIPYSNDMESCVYMRGNEVESFEVDQRYITKRYTEESLEFIDAHKQEPFFLYLAHSMPHVPLYVSEKFEGSSKRGLYGDVIQEIDWSVGEVLKKLEELGLLENTLIVFSSDNGPWIALAEHGGSSGGLREGKFFTFEGGMRVPTVAMWKGTIPAGQVFEDLASQMDWFPTFAAMAGIQIPDDRSYDGVDIMNVLKGEGKRSRDGYLYFEGGDAQCYRKGDWKLKKLYKGRSASPAWFEQPPHDTLLFNLKNDPQEKENRIQEFPQIVAELEQEMAQALADLGPLPPGIPTRSRADESHWRALEAKAR